MRFTVVVAAVVAVASAAPVAKPHGKDLIAHSYVL